MPLLPPEILIDDIFNFYAQHPLKSATKGQARDHEMKPSTKTRGRPRKSDDRAAAREELLDAAHLLMSERGTIDVPANEIAQRAGLSVALVNYYFGSKDGLLLALALHHQARFGLAMERLAALPENAETKLRLHVRGLVRALRRVPYLQRLLHSVVRESGDETREAAGEALLRPMADFYRRLVAQGVAEGAFRPVDPMHLYVALNGAAEYLFVGRASLKYGFDIEALDDTRAEAFVDFLIGLVRGGILAK